MAAISALEARIKIKSKGLLTPKLSVMGSLACSYFNQGCNGGYPYLIAKQAHDIGFFEVTTLFLNSRISARLMAMTLTSATIIVIKTPKSGKSKTMVRL